ncbi:MAG: FAD-dependent oxidoreductase [Gammaproteobacteria bacterium]|jgi:predicted NAD/FAD-binding protein|nr:FAD-dependent oxidoreductase [Gammaproteobacteria bacterium]MCP4881926.1 FAD-dependent oxidoreductase [Gammaproteobacteria bacterium]MDP6166381.1 FAD-dependent oxidoreductase [Gammaproteobacteria bacterium]
MKVAIIGGGISGNTAAYYLHPKHDITLFEAGNHLGGHTHTHDVESEGKNIAIDTGFIVFNDRTYPLFNNLLSDLEVPIQKTQMSFSVANNETGLEYNGHNLSSLFAQRSNVLNLGFLSMLKDIVRFNRQARQLSRSMQDSLSLGELLVQQNYGQMFINNYILPMGAAIWSTDPNTMLQFPARFFIRFFENHGLLNLRNRPQWYVVAQGSARYVEAMATGYMHRVQLNTAIESVQRQAQGVMVKPVNQPAQQFDRVFMATHSNQSLAILGAHATPKERQVLSAIPYQTNEVVLHTDASLMPRNRRAWAAWNYHIDQQQTSANATVTYHMNCLQGLDTQQDFFVSLNASERIAPSKVIKTLHYEHPVFTPEGVDLQQQQGVLNEGPILYCGAYWGKGFHEDGVASALSAVGHMEDQYA